MFEGLSENSCLLTHDLKGDTPVGAVEGGETIASAEYPDAEWVSSPNFWKGGMKVNRLVIHDMEGYYDFVVYDWFRRASSQVSAHFSVDFDGRIAQQVSMDDIAWHVAYANPTSIGIEHSGFVSQYDPKGNYRPYTDVQYHASAKLAAFICKKFGLKIEHNTDGGICFHSDLGAWGNTHTDPGKYWKMDYYLSLVKKYAGVKEFKWDAPKYVFVTSSKDTVERARFVVPRINAVTGKVLAAWTGRYDKARYASQQSFDSDLGKFETIVMKGAEDKISQSASDVLGKYDKGESDIWDGRDDGKMVSVLHEIERREGIFDLTTDYTNEFGKAVRSRTAILGGPRISKEKAIAFAKKVNAAPDFFTLIDLAYDKYGPLFGYGADFMVAQMANESNWGRFGRLVKPSMHNPVGLKKHARQEETTDAHQSFDSWDTGVKAYCQHLSVYVGVDPHKPIVDDRYTDIINMPWANSVKQIDGKLDNWSGHSGYHDALLNILDEMEK